jgi:hypothetical protein
MAEENCSKFNNKKFYYTIKQKNNYIIKINNKKITMLNLPTIITVIAHILGMITCWSYVSLLLYYNPNVAWWSGFYAKRGPLGLLI